MNTPQRPEFDSSVIIRDVVQLLEDAGVSRGKLLRDAAISAAELDNPMGSIRSTADQSLWPCAIRETGDAAIGLHIGERARIQGLGLVGYMLMNCPNLGEALRQFIRFQNQVTTHYQLHLGTEPGARDGDSGGVRVTITPRNEDMPTSRIEHTLAAMVTLGRWLTGRSFALLKAQIKHAAPPHAGEYTRVFGCPVRFGQPTNALFASADTLALPVIQPIPTLFKTLEILVSEQPSVSSQPEVFTDAVRRAIAQTMSSGSAHAGVIAASLSVTPRTLPRRLKQEGLTLLGLMNAHRRAVAEKLLTEQGFPLAEIAYFLGYSETSAFSRAFKRWTGQTPADYKKGRRAP